MRPGYTEIIYQTAQYGVMFKLVFVNELFHICIWDFYAVSKWFITRDTQFSISKISN